MTDAWSTKFKATWLDAPEACRELDDHLAKLMAAHRKLRGEAASTLAVLPLRCEPTAAVLQTLGVSPSSSIQTTILLALLGELLLCAEEGGILRKDTVERIAAGEPEREIVPDAVRLLRNAVCHPASAREDVEETGIASFADFIVTNFKEETWATELRTRPGDLARREVAFFALRLINGIGWERAERWKLRMKGTKRPHKR